MPIFETNANDLSVTILLDPEDGPIDLTRDNLGGRILDLAVSGMVRSAGLGRSPAGTPWARLKSATIQTKGHDIPGVKSGTMFTCLSVGGERDITPDRATWSYPRNSTFAYAQAFHAGRDDARTGKQVQPARPLIGWTDEAETQARALLIAAIQQDETRHGETKKGSQE